MRQSPRGHFLKEWRESMGMTQKQFAEHVGMSVSNYNYLEAGKIGYTQASLETIAHGLEVPPSRLLSTNPLHAPEAPLPYRQFYEDFDSLNEDDKELAMSLVGTLRQHRMRHAPKFQFKSRKKNVQE